MMESTFKWIAKYPIKLGLALQATGHALMGAGAISSVNGAHGVLVEGSVWAGFFMGAAGTFFATLFTNGKSNDFPQQEKEKLQ